MFFEELVGILDTVMTYGVPVIVAGDFNIHLERTNDAHTVKLVDLMSTYGLSCQVSKPTHVRGGTIDLIFSTAAQSVEVNVVDNDLSDLWSSVLPLPPLSYRDSTFSSLA